VRALVQRVTKAEVAVDGQVIGQSGPGLLILVCAMQGDTEAEAETRRQDRETAHLPG
jgi:D-tyrosyl-tRNA(Tyr) deacylase